MVVGHGMKTLAMAGFLTEVITTRPVWYPDDRSAVSYESVAEGQARFGRAPDASGIYMVEPGGGLVHLFDAPSSFILLEFGLGVSRCDNPVLTANGSAQDPTAQEKERRSWSRHEIE